MNENEKYWKKCVDFHGHECGGLAIGFIASLYAKELLSIDFSEDEDVVCVTENDACGVDAVQVLLGCSAGKGNLIFKLRGKQAFSFYNRKTGKSVRLVLKNEMNLKGEELRKYFNENGPKELFEIKETTFILPERARIFNSIKCEKCGETAAESMIRLEDGKKVCLDCSSPYSRIY